jgi:hypothetical protein
VLKVTSPGDPHDATAAIDIKPTRKAGRRRMR